jgi:hypothetical protein
MFLKQIYKPKKSDMELRPIASFFLIGHQSNGHVPMLFNSLTTFWASLKCKLILYMFFHGYDAMCLKEVISPFRPSVHFVEQGLQEQLVHCNK